MLQEKLDRCLLCHDAPCAKQCPHHIPVDSIVRSMRFGNAAGAALRLPGQDCCAACAAPCETACLRRNAPVEIRHILAALRAQNLPQPSGAKPDLATTFCGVRLENPFLLASSVISSTYEKMARAFDMGWAGASFKTICDFIPQEASPRYAASRERSSFAGFKNIEQLSTNTLDEDLDIIRRLKRDYPTKVILASIMGRDEAEWERLARLVEDAGADMVECNFSCPNMMQEGLGSDIGQSAEAVATLTAAARRGCRIPLLAKLTPNVTDMPHIALAAMHSGADGLAAINTIKSLMGMDLDTHVTQPNVQGYSGVGGYSGRAVKPIAQRFIWELASHPELAGVPITGMGGIETWRDAVAFLLLGASNVQICTAVMQFGYRIIDDLLEGLELYLAQKGLHSPAELVGLGVSKVQHLDLLDRSHVRYPRFERSKCLGCGRCYLSCRDGGHEAIAMRDDRPILHAKQCVGCHLCVLVCPTGAIGVAESARKRE